MEEKKFNSEDRNEVMKEERKEEVSAKMKEPARQARNANRLHQFRRILRYYLKKCPMATILILSVIVVMVSSIFLTVFGRYQFRISFDHPLFVSVMRKEYKEVKDKKRSKASEQEEGKDAAQTADALADAATTEELVVGIPTEYEEYKKTKVTSPYYSDPGKVALTTNYPYITVDKSYYEDALFIGDSRVEGLKLYSQMDNATYYCKQGISVYNMMTEKIAKVKGKATTIPKALKQKKFNKIFIMVGINELGVQDTETYAKKYSENIAEIKKLQPDAVIFIMAVMKVTDNYASQSDIVNNVNINDKNVAAAGLANGIDIFYIDMNPCVTKKNGGVRSDYTWDGIHLKAEYYDIWDEFLNTHGLPNEMFPAYANMTEAPVEETEVPTEEK